MKSILNLSRHLTLDSNSILVWTIRKPRLGKQTTTWVENWLNHWAQKFSDQRPDVWLLLVVSELHRGLLVGLTPLNISVSGLDGDTEHHERIARWYKNKEWLT